ncbi:unnamed protein product [Clavelina lepadiformis]|uniref:CBM21 domain-containing protein n=1 Tax=Clavelina lepadiformis TaxID=159417 RepID=A0ABP0FTS1_CLALP
MAVDECGQFAHQFSNLSLQNSDDDTTTNGSEENLSDRVDLHTTVSESLFERPPAVDRLKASKSVSFADRQGGKLVEICEFDGSADFVAEFNRAHGDLTSRSYPSPPNQSPEPERYFLLFPQPFINQNFSAVLWSQSVCLQSARIMNNTANGSIKVMNLAYQKQVDIKITSDMWSTCWYQHTTYSHSESEEVDVFVFNFIIPATARFVKFCIRYFCQGRYYWDNNRGMDYCIAARN